MSQEECPAASTLESVLRLDRTRARFPHGRAARVPLFGGRPYSLLTGATHVERLGLALDLARRIWFANRLPDGSMSPYLPETPTLWLSGRMWGKEFLRICASGKIPGRAIHFAGSDAEVLASMDGYGPHRMASGDVSKPAIADAVAAQAQRIGAGLVVIEEPGYLTNANLYVDQSRRDAFLGFCRQATCPVLIISDRSSPFFTDFFAVAAGEAMDVICDREPFFLLTLYNVYGDGHTGLTRDVWKPRGYMRGLIGKDGELCNAPLLSYGYRIESDTEVQKDNA